MHSPRTLLCLVLLASCGSTNPAPPYDPALDGLILLEANPATMIPGSTLVLSGRSFVGAPWGSPTLSMTGTFDNGSEQYRVEFRSPARFVDSQTLEIPIDAEFLDLLGSNSGTFLGNLRIEIDSTVDSKRHLSPPLAVELDFRDQLAPSLVSLDDSGPLYVNDQIAVTARNLLLGGGEGQSLALVRGCFVTANLGMCVPVEDQEIEIAPTTAFDRSSGQFVFTPRIAGIKEGHFEGDVQIINRNTSGQVQESEIESVSYDLSETTVFSLGQSQVSLGQYLYVDGAGFVRNGPDSSTLLEMTGSFTPLGEAPIDIDLILVPEFVNGRTLRYVINEDDSLGQRIDLRHTSGQFSGSIVTQVTFVNQAVFGQQHAFELGLDFVKQVVYLDFTPQYLGALRAFGLRALDLAIRERVARSIERDFRTINVDIRLEEPSDFSLYSTVEIGGMDPNGLGLLGYDNTPGKDVGNERLHDYIGGVNATTQQEDGYPGYGGIFIESLFVFSEHPGDLARSAGISDPLFDDIFDSFRPDRGGEPVRAADLGADIVFPTSGQACPATERPAQIGCAAWTLPNLISSTISHEVGHSLGLANPQGGGFHHDSDAPNRLMDPGSFRPFDERAELRSAGPGQFCDQAYEYLRQILPTDQGSDLVGRPTCL